MRDCHASTDVWGSNFRFAFYMNLGTFNRCPLHIPPLRRGPSPAGEGRGLPVSVYVHLSYSVPSVFGQLVSAPTAMCLVGTYSPGVSPHRFCVPMFLWCDCHWQSFIWNSLRGAPPLIRRLRAAPSPRGRFFSFPLGVYVPPKASPWGSWQGAALTDEGAVQSSGTRRPGRIRIPPEGSPPAFSGFRRCPQADVEGTPCEIAVLKKTFQLQIPRFSFVFLPALALVIGVPSTFPRCGGHLRKPEKAGACPLGYTCNQALYSVGFRAA